MSKYISNFTFVVITFNEEFAVHKCLDSIAKLPLNNCEIICIDSGSKDSTLEVIKSYKTKINNLRLFQISGYANSAVARNIGISNATKEYVFFIDGDIEIKRSFFDYVFNCFRSGIYVAVVGDLLEIQYSFDYSKILKIVDSRYKFVKEKEVYFSGGTFVVKRNILYYLGLFDERLERSQDFDYTLRLTRRYKMLSVPVTMGVHHTIPYSNIIRIRKSLLKNNFGFLGMAIRKNILNMSGVVRFFSSSGKGITLGFFYYMLIMFFMIMYEFPTNMLLVGTIFAFDFLKAKVSRNNFLFEVYLHFIGPLMFLSGLFFDIDRRKTNKIVEISL